ncbi:hypothetical protein N9E56_02000 [Flavobacteriaceae bacterium]|nr:hypothetical protein [Flavobacteriaceae bacterium]
MKVRERQKAIDYLKKRQLETSYFKAKSYLSKDQFKMVDLKKRRPYKLNKFYFRINHQFQAFGYINDSNELIVTDISDHQ